MRQLEEDHKAWLARFINGDDEPAPAPDVAAGDFGEASATSSTGTPDGNSHRQQPNPQAKLTAQQIKDMDMATYAQLRAELGVQSPTSMSRLSGH